MHHNFREQKTFPVSTPTQHFKEECLADRGYRLQTWQGQNGIWHLKGICGNIMHVATVTPSGEVIYQQTNR